MAKRSDRGRLPDFIGIGVPKSASNWLYQCLIAHPEVVAPRKELHFFSDSRAYRRGIEHYAAAFHACPIDRIAGEFTPIYMSGLETAARMRRWLPQVRIIASLRDPVQRAFSHYKYSIQMHARLSSRSTFEAAIEYDPELLDQGLYGEQLERYYALFPPENILVLMHEEILAKPTEVIRRLYEFVGISDTSFMPSQAHHRVNQAGSFAIAERVPLASRLLYSVRHHVRPGGELERLAVASGAASLARRVIKANRFKVPPATVPAPSRPAPVLLQETADRLHDRYREDGERLRRLLGRDIPWLERPAAVPTAAQ